MNRDIMIKDLTSWIKDTIESAVKDETFDISWFNGTKDAPFSIIAGWERGFSENYADLICISKSNPEYAMCIKIVINERPYAYTDFELMNMPCSADGTVDDTCVALQWEDDPVEAAQFFLGEWERIMKEHGEEI